MLTGVNKTLEKNPVPQSVWVIQIPHGPTWNQTHSFVFRGRFVIRQLLMSPEQNTWSLGSATLSALTLFNN